LRRRNVELAGHSYIAPRGRTFRSTAGRRSRSKEKGMRLFGTLTAAAAVGCAGSLKCTPHYAMGMVMMVAVGDPAANLDAARAAKNPKNARARLDAGFAQVGG
jgi:hypothetical protein